MFLYIAIYSSIEQLEIERQERIIRTEFEKTIETLEDQRNELAEKIQVRKNKCIFVLSYYVGMAYFVILIYSSSLLQKLEVNDTHNKKSFDKLKAELSLVLQQRSELQTLSEQSTKELAERREMYKQETNRLVEENKNMKQKIEQLEGQVTTAFQLTQSFSSFWFVYIGWDTETFLW